MRTNRFKFISVIILFAFSLNILAQHEFDPMPDKVTPAPTKIQKTPCDDSLYVLLKAKDINALTPNELTYFMQKDGECKQYKQDSASDIERQQKAAKIKNTIAPIVVIVVLAVLAAIIIPIVIVNQKIQQAKNTTY